MSPLNIFFSATGLFLLLSIVEYKNRRRSNFWFFFFVASFIGTLSYMIGYTSRFITYILSGIFLLAIIQIFVSKKKESIVQKIFQRIRSKNELSEDK